MINVFAVLSLCIAGLLMAIFMKIPPPSARSFPGYSATMTRKPPSSYIEFILKDKTVAIRKDKIEHIVIRDKQIILENTNKIIKGPQNSIDIIYENLLQDRLDSIKIESEKMGEDSEIIYSLPPSEE